VSFFSEACTWLQVNYIEITAVLTGLMYVVFAIKRNRILWLFGIVSSALYILVFYRSGIFAYMILYVYYVLIGIYGWFNWSKNNGSGTVKITIVKASGLYVIICLLVTLTTAFPIYLVLRKFTHSDVAVMDALLTSSGMVATWMLTQKIIQQWLFWIAIDLATMALMVFKNLYPSALLFFIYTLLAAKGYKEWRIELQKQEM
jgi:nicotinamide mononucleotide transporter